MSKKVVLVGHCGADSTYLKLAVKAAEPMAEIIGADSDAELRAALDGGAALVLFNRQVDYGFATTQGVDLLRAYHAAYPSATLMMVTNYPESQAAAIAAGGLPGFGKREIGSPRVKELLRSVLVVSSSSGFRGQ